MSTRANLKKEIYVTYEWRLLMDNGLLEQLKELYLDHSFDSEQKAIEALEKHNEKDWAPDNLVLIKLYNTRIDRGQQ